MYGPVKVIAERMLCEGSTMSRTKMCCVAFDKERCDMVGISDSFPFSCLLWGSIIGGNVQLSNERKLIRFCCKSNLGETPFHFFGTANTFESLVIGLFLDEGLKEGFPVGNGILADCTDIGSCLT